MSCYDFPSLSKQLVITLTLVDYATTVKTLRPWSFLKRQKTNLD